MNFTDKATVEEIVKKCVDGDRKSQHILYKAFYGKMLSVCARYTGDYDEAKDLVQDSFLKVFLRLKGFENKGSLEGWIRRIVVNNAIDHIRLKKEFIVKEEDSDIFDNIEYEDPQVEIDHEQYRMLKAQRVMDLIQKLTPAYKTVFNLYVIENYTHQEIAEILDISIGTSKSNLAKAKMKLREMFEAEIKIKLK